MVTGGLVRLTGSGLGCPSWPECVPGSYTPVPHQAEGWHRYIEFGNRTLTSVVSIAALATVYAVWRWAARRRDLLVPALGVLVGVGVQAVLGGITVRTGLNPSPSPPTSSSRCAWSPPSTYLVFRAPEPAGPRPLVVHPLVERLGWATCAVAAVVLLLGTVVTGSGPHSGDADEPARFGFDPRTISWLHADAVMLFIGLVVAVWVASRLGDAPAAPGRAWARGVRRDRSPKASSVTRSTSPGCRGWSCWCTCSWPRLLVVALTRAMVRAARQRPARLTDSTRSLVQLRLCK